MGEFLTILYVVQTKASALPLGFAEQQVPKKREGSSRGARRILQRLQQKLGRALPPRLETN